MPGVPRYAYGALRLYGRTRDLCCPYGHLRGDGHLVIGADHFRCEELVPDTEHPAAKRLRHCGARVWVTVVPQLELLDVREVDYADLLEIRTHRTALEALDYLGAPRWRPPALQPRGDVTRRRRRAKRRQAPTSASGAGSATAA